MMLIPVRTPKVFPLQVWPLPVSLATTPRISIDFSSSAYLDVSVRRVPFHNLWIQLWIYDSSSQRFPHSEIYGSKLISSSPQLIAGNRVLHRLLVPRHSPYALFRLNSLTCFILSNISSSLSFLLELSQIIVLGCKFEKTFKLTLFSAYVFTYATNLFFYPCYYGKTLN